MNTLATTRTGKVTVSTTGTADEYMPIAFVKDTDRRMQAPLLDPGELYYNPSTKTLHCDRFLGGIPSLIESEAIELTTSDDQTKIDVNFSKNTDSITSLVDDDTHLISNNSNELKTISRENLETDLKPTANDNLSYGTGVNSNQLNLNSTIENTALDSGCSWNGNLILASKLSNGLVSDSEF